MSFGVRIPCPECRRPVGVFSSPGDRAGRLVNHGDQRFPLERIPMINGRRRPVCSGSGRDVAVRE
jgi:hypothetical protein